MDKIKHTHTEDDDDDTVICIAALSSARKKRRTDRYPNTGKKVVPGGRGKQQQLKDTKKF
jgi:hypothetical protein